MVMKHKNRTSTCGFKDRIIAILASTCLAISLLAAGYTACLIPVVSNAFSHAFVQDQMNPYSKADLVQLSIEIRNYTVCDYGRSEGGTEQARETLAKATLKAAENSSCTTEKQDRWNSEALQLINSPIAKSDPNRAVDDLSQISNQYALDNNALEHLDDCHELMTQARSVLIGVALLGLICFVYLLSRRQFLYAGRALIAGPLILALCAIALIIWCVIDFNSFFSLFHLILFPQGNWTFPFDSLLICSLPLNFWMVMAGLWLAVSLCACIIAMVLGWRLKNR